MAAPASTAFGLTNRAAAVGVAAPKVLGLVAV